MKAEALSELMARTGYAKWPARWEEWYPSVQEAYAPGCLEITDPAYYDDLSRTFDFGPHLPYYKQAAEAAGKDRDLTMLLMLLLRTMDEEEEDRRSDLKALSPSRAVEGKDALACRMIPALAVCSQLRRAYDLHRSRNISEELTLRVLNPLIFYVDLYRRKHGGEYGYDLMVWSLFTLEAKLFPAHRLQMEFFGKLASHADVFRGKDGSLVSLSAAEETADGWTGHSYDERGTLSEETVTLPRAQYEKILSCGDPVIRVHIPASGPLTPESVDDALAYIREFAAAHYPDFHYKALTCTSWTLDPQLWELLGENSNIVKFSKRFHHLDATAGRAVFDFVFHLPNLLNVDYNALPESTHLERALKQHYLADGKIDNVDGFILPEEIPTL